MRNGATGQGSNSVQVSPVQRAGHPDRAPSPGRGLQGRSRPPCPAHQQHRRRRSSVTWRSSTWSASAASAWALAASRRRSFASNPKAPTRIGVKLGRRSLDALLVDFAGRVLERRRLERAFPMPEEALAFASESVAGLRRLIRWPGTAGWPASGVAMPYNLGSWQRELDIPLAAYRRWNEFDLGRAAGRRDRARGVLRERRHGRRRGRAVPGPGPRARRLPLRLRRRGASAAASSWAATIAAASTPMPATSA